MRRRHPIAAVVFIGVFAGLAIVALAHGYVDPPSAAPATTDLREFFAWLRLIGGVMGMIFGIGGTVFYYRAIIALKTNDAAKSAIDMYQKEIDAARMSRQRVYEENTALTQTVTALQVELAALREKTDLSAVMANQREALAQNQELNHAIVDTLHAITEKGDRQYSEALGVLQGIMSHLNDMAAENQKQLAKNSDVLANVLGIVERAEKRWNSVQARVDVLQDKIDDKT